MVLGGCKIRKEGSELTSLTDDLLERKLMFNDKSPDDRLANSVLFDHIEQAFRFLGPRFCGDANEFLGLLRRRTDGLFGDQVPPSSARPRQDEAEVATFRA